MTAADPGAGDGPRLPQALAASFATHADAVALVAYDREGGRRSWRYAELGAAARALAADLRRAGVAPGDRVATLSRNRPEVLVAYLGCWLAGVVACPVNVEESEARRRRILEHARCRLLLVEAEQRGAADALAAGLPAPARVAPLEGLLDGPFDAAKGTPSHESSAPSSDAGGAFLVYTSGTTGHARGVLLSGRNLVANARATADWHGLAPGTAVMTVLPVHHVNGAVVTGLAPLLAGATVVLNPAFSPRTFWRRLADERAAIASVVPTLLEFLLSADEDLAPYDLSALRYLLCGAGPLLATTAERFEERFGVALCHGFGMSETTAYNTQMPMDLPDHARRRLYGDGPPSVGCALACNEVAVLRPDGSGTDPGERGEIAVRGASVMEGYLDDPEATARAFRDGWFLSGDEGYWRERHGRRFFFLSGRIKEMIVRGGANLSPLEVDEVLRRLPGVAFAVTVGFANRAYGEEVAAYVVPEEGVALSERDVLAHARRALPFASCPKVVVFGSDVPFTVTGKPKRLALAERLAPDLARYRERQFRPDDPLPGDGADPIETPG